MTGSDPNLFNTFLNVFTVSLKRDFNIITRNMLSKKQHTQALRLKILGVSHTNIIYKLVLFCLPIQYRYANNS